MCVRAVRLTINHQPSEMCMRNRTKKVTHTFEKSPNYSIKKERKIEDVPYSFSVVKGDNSSGTSQIRMKSILSREETSNNLTFTSSAILQNSRSVLPASPFLPFFGLTRLDSRLDSVETGKTKLISSK